MLEDRRDSLPDSGFRKAHGDEPLDFVGRLSRFEIRSPAPTQGSLRPEDILTGDHPRSPVKVATVGPVRIMASLNMDTGQVRSRLQQRREELRSEVARAEGKLANEKFVARAPAELVEEERAKLERHRSELEELAE